MKKQLYNADCLEKMKEIPDGSIDLVLTDPPYGTTACKWDNIIPFEPMWEQYKRIIKKNGAIVLFGSQPFTSALVMSNTDMFRYCWYYKKERLTNPLTVKKMAGKVIEECCVFYQKQPVFNAQKTIHLGKRVKNNPKGNHGETTCNKLKVTPYNDDGTRYPIQLLEIKRDVQKSHLHPTQKPVALFEYLIKTYTNEGEIVLDNCAGSGTTGVACKNLNRNYILIEKEPEYVEIIKKRLS